ncbi:MAG TPA: NAD(P)-binding protein, partial [Steroidobacteraceae bacterium]|nr:NAD(P)-binding protein [Steroidobacteraceae bacterium]
MRRGRRVRLNCLWWSKERQSDTSDLATQVTQGRNVLVRPVSLVSPLSPMSPAAAFQPPMSSQHFDVLIVGAGISGIGAGCHLQKECPGKRYAILEGRADLGGTWDL